MANQITRSTSCIRPTTFCCNSGFVFRARAAVAFVLLCAWLAVPAANAEQGLLLDQEIKVFGEMQVLVSPIGLRVVNQRVKTVVVSAAPDWKIVSYNPKTKLIFIVDDPRKYRSALIASNNVFSGFNLASTPLVRKGSARVLDMPTIHYDSDKAFANAQRAAYVRGDQVGATPLVVHYDLFDQTKIPQKAADILSRIYGLPHASGLPAQLWYDSCDIKLRKYLTTDKVKTAQCSKKDFVYPKDYKHVKDEAQLNSMNPDDFEELFHMK